MQDFVNKETILSNSSNLKKQEKWLNKDRIWNFVFWFGMSLGLALATTFRDLNIMVVATFLYIVTLMGIPFLLWFFNRARLTRENKILNSEGSEITKDQLPYSWPFATICGPFFAFVVVETFFSSSANGLFVSFIMFFIFTAGFSLYFIFKNCPIAILFSRHTWSMRTTGMFTTPQESTEFGVKLFNVVEALDAKLKSEQNNK